MMDKVKFTSVYRGLLKNKGIEIDNEALEFAYACMKNDFTDNEFRTIAIEIYKNEKLYNSIDVAPLFYEKKKNLPPSDELQKDIDDLIDWIPSLSGMLDYKADADVESFINKKINDRQKECLNQLGGMALVRAYKKERKTMLDLRDEITEKMKNLDQLQEQPKQLEQKTSDAAKTLEFKPTFLKKIGG